MVKKDENKIEIYEDFEIKRSKVKWEYLRLQDKHIRK